MSGDSKILECQKDVTFYGEFRTSDFMTVIYHAAYYYSVIHIYLVMIFTFIDFLSNALIIFVLSQPELRFSGINLTMIMISICNFLSIALTLVQNIFEYINRFHKSFIEASYGWVELYLNTFLSTMANYLTIQMAFCRVMALFSNSDKWNGRKRVVYMSLMIWIFVGLSSATIIPTISVHWDEFGERYITTISDAFVENECIFFRALLFFIGFLFQLLPCVLIFMFSVLILWKIRQSRSHRSKMFGLKSLRTIDRSSRLLQVILIMFLVSKFPEALVNIFSAFYLLDYIILVAPLTSDFLDMLSIVNASASFIIYCTMSSVFRTVFLRMFVPVSIRQKLEKVNTIFRFAGKSRISDKRSSNHSGGFNKESLAF